MQTKVLIIQAWEESGERQVNRSRSLQEQTDQAIAELGEGWNVRSAETFSCVRGASNCVYAFGQMGFFPKTFFTTTIVMEKK